jgi:hypothetical protein
MRGCAFANCAAAESARVNYLIAMIIRPYRASHCAARLD